MFLAGPRTLVSGRQPDGESFTIIGERFRFQGRVYFCVEFNRNQLCPRYRRGKFIFFNETGRCAGSFVAFFGVLNNREATALVRTGGRTRSLTLANIPRGLDARGVLVYGFLPVRVSRLMVRSAGRTIESHVLGLPYRPCPAGTGYVTTPSADRYGN